MRKAKKNIQYAIISLLLVSILFYIFRNTKMLFYIFIMLYIINILLIMIFIIKYFKEEKKIINEVFDSYYKIYELLIEYNSNFKNNKKVLFDELSDKINNYVFIIRNKLDEYDSILGNKTIKNNIKIGVDSLDFSESNVKKILDNDKQVMGEFFYQMINIIKKLLLLIDEKEFKQRINQ